MPQIELLGKLVPKRITEAALEVSGVPDTIEEPVTLDRDG